MLYHPSAPGPRQALSSRLWLKRWTTERQRAHSSFTLSHAVMRGSFPKLPMCKAPLLPPADSSYKPTGKGLLSIGERDPHFQQEAWGSDLKGRVVWCCSVPVRGSWSPWCRETPSGQVPQGRQPLPFAISVLSDQSLDVCLLFGSSQFTHQG